METRIHHFCLDCGSFSKDIHMFKREAYNRKSKDVKDSHLHEKENEKRCQVQSALILNLMS